ncbi:MAG: hypothetical protein SWO11_07905 [Thermodesulfobacteriota bacterium]|nr:hypothetical protein [Thermodesulfobacteriota bacterium]
MKRLLLSIFIFSFAFINTAHAGPFGLSMGMTKQELGRMEEISTNRYRLHTVPNPDQNFSDYIVIVGDRSGLCRIRALSVKIRTNGYGSEVKDKFKSLESALNERYGKHKKQDILLPKSKWKEPKDWMMGLLKEERFLESFWDIKESSNLPDNIQSILLRATAVKTNKGMIILEYIYKNFGEFMKEGK